jgi:hypothetical protein
LSLHRPATHGPEASQWNLARDFLASLFGTNYCLAADASLLLHARSLSPPDQLTVMTTSESLRIKDSPTGLDVFAFRDEPGFPSKTVEICGLMAMTLEEALLRVGEGFFRNNSDSARRALSAIKDGLQICTLLDEGRADVAGRLAGAFRANGQTVISNQIYWKMLELGCNIAVTNPFERRKVRMEIEPSPYENRIREMWSNMREAVLKSFPQKSDLIPNPGATVSAMDGSYIRDAFNSLSIEGYRVTPEFVGSMRRPDWRTSEESTDHRLEDQLAARGYFQAFCRVRRTVEHLLNGESAAIIRQDHRDWYEALFGPSVLVGIAHPLDLKGYRNHPVYIAGSHHVPPSPETVPAAMATLFDLLEGEPDPAVRAVLGHFIFTFIHPYGDGNGRLARLLMNSMLFTGGYPWAVISVRRRTDYLSTLEAASCHGDITPFAEHVASEMRPKPMGS